MRLEIHMNMDNAAFRSDVDGEWQKEAARVLNSLAARLMRQTLTLALYDINGNNVGSAVLVED